MRIVLALIASLLMSSCSITKRVVQPVEPIEKGASICIEINSLVIEEDVLAVIQSGVQRNGFKPRLYRKIPDDCRYSLTYVAHQKWDFVKILSSADIRLFDKNELIGSVEYRLPAGIFGSGGVNPEKFESTDGKLSPLIDQLFSLANR